MNCLNDIISNYDMAVRCLSSRHLENVIRFRSKIDMVFDMLSDEDSKYIFAQDVLYCMLSNFVIQELSALIAGNITWPEFRGYVNRAHSMREFDGMVHQGTAISEDIKYQCIATTFLLEQYRYKDLVRILPGDVCIDAGACLGDTSLYFCMNGAQKVYSFEIDRSNIECLKKTVGNYSMEQKIQICEAALADRSGSMFFTPDPGNYGAGKIGMQQGEGSYSVETTTIDAFCEANGIHPTFIKMDIEGAEPSAIMGARQTILKERPRFAVSIYHAWQHRWELPLMLRDITPGYNYYIKKSQPYTETILFGVPR